MEGAYTTEQVAEKLGISERTVRHQKKRYTEQGESSLVHGNSGRIPANYIDEELRTRIVALRKSDAHGGVSVSRFRKVLAEQEGIKISYTTLSGILKAEGIASKTKKGEAGPFRHKGAFGEMLGAASHFHDWFGDGTPCVLHGLADDATKRITGLYFCRDECVKGYIEVLRQTVTNHGIPLELYAENRETLFRGTSGLGFIVGNWLGIDITADTDAPHAKKRVAHLWKALRNGFPRWLKKLGIADMERANGELHRYIALFNGRFAKEPRMPEASFVPLGDHNLDLLLALRHVVATDSRGRFLFNGFVFIVDSEKPLAHKKIEFLFGEEIGFLAHCEGEYHKVSFHGSKNKDRVVRPSNALKVLIQESYCVGLGDLRNGEVNKENFPR